MMGDHVPGFIAPPPPPEPPKPSARCIDLTKVTAEDMGRWCIWATREARAGRKPGEELRPSLELWLAGELRGPRIRIFGAATGKVLVRHARETFVRVWVDHLWPALTRQHPEAMRRLEAEARQLTLAQLKLWAAPGSSA